MIRAGELKDWAEAARLIQVTRARMTQIANLLLLEPDIQETILTLLPILRSGDPITERDLRPIVSRSDWELQKTVWFRLTCPLHNGPVVEVEF
jgi:hypothetical protein